MMLNAYTTQETAALTEFLTPNLAFRLKLLRSQPARTNPGIDPDINPSIYLNTYQSDTNSLKEKDQTADGQAVKCINGGATTVSVKFDLTVTEDAFNTQSYVSELFLELGSINAQGAYIFTQSYTENKIRFSDPGFGPRRVVVFEDLEIKDAKATQNLVIRLTEKKQFSNSIDITNPFSTISLSKFNATFPQPRLA